MEGGLFLTRGPYERAASSLAGLAHASCQPQNPRQDGKNRMNVCVNMSSCRLRKFNPGKKKKKLNEKEKLPKNSKFTHFLAILAARQAVTVSVKIRWK